MKLGRTRRVVLGRLLAVLCAAQIAPALAQSRKFGRVARRESQYAATYVDRDGDYLTMRFGINRCLFTESRYNPSDPAELPVAYTQYMTVALAYAANLSEIVEIGLGGGRIATYIHDFITHANVTCIELDPGVIDLAQRYFDVRPGPRLKLVNSDGRVYMASAKQTFDLVLVDAYQGTLVPFHLVTREFYAILQRRLAPGGVVAQNIAPSVLDLPRMLATARAVFDHVDLYPAQKNWVLIAYDGNEKTDAQLKARARQLQETHSLRYSLEDMLSERYADASTNHDDAPAFTDDFAPVGYKDYDKKCRDSAD